MTKPKVDDWDKVFWNWHQDVFGFGYGNGELHWIPALRMFLSRCRKNDDYSSLSYRFDEIERALTPTVAWLLINTLCQHSENLGDSILEYGASPRYGWLTESGEHLKEFFTINSDDEIYRIATLHHDYWMED